jgi:hypothetical protein
LPQQGQTVPAGQKDVHQDEIRGFAGDRLEHVGGQTYVIDLVSVELEQDLEQGDGGGVVVDDEDFRHP